VRRVLLSPTWLVGHVVVIALAVVFVRLGVWQFQRSRETNWNPQYLSYGLQWPVFAAFGVAMWIRIVRDAAHPERRLEREERAHRERRPGRRPAPTPAAGPAPPNDAADAADPELAAYNRYLAHLDERTRPDRRESR